MDDTPGREITDADIRDVVKVAAALDGWRYDAGTSRGGHPMLYPADRTQRPISVPTTPSDKKRSIKNLRAQIRRAGSQV